MKGRQIHFASLMDLCHLKNSELEPQYQKYKEAGSYSEVTLWKMSQDHVQYLLNKDHQRLKRRQPRSWISYPDCQDAQDKQLTQYLLKLRSKWKMHQKYWEFQNRNVQTNGYVYRNTNGQNHGPVWKTQSFLLSEICMVILWQDCCGKSNLRKILLQHGWKKVSNWECLFVHRQQRVILICVCGRYQIGWKETVHQSDLENCWKTLIWETQHHFLTMFILGCTQRECQISKDFLDSYRSMFESRIPARATEKLPETEATGKPDVETMSSFHGSTTRKVMQRNAWKGIANLRTKQLNCFTKSQFHALIINSKKKKMDQLENCPQFAHKLFWNVFFWFVVVDLIFYGPWTSLLVRSQNGPEHVEI